MATQLLQVLLQNIYRAQTEQAVHCMDPRS